MKIFEYKNYDHYVESQVEANVRKIKNVWVQRTTIEKIKELQQDAKHILCHGTRNAAEQKYFRECYPEAEIIGTEISHTANDFPMTVQHDFHEVRKDWIEKFDIVYSNSFDHSYDPEKSLSAWKGQLSINGCMYIEHGFEKKVNVCKVSDPLQIFAGELLELFDSIGLEHQADFLNESETAKIYKLRKKT